MANKIELAKFSLDEPMPAKKFNALDKEDLPDTETIQRTAETLGAATRAAAEFGPASKQAPKTAADTKPAAEAAVEHRRSFSFPEPLFRAMRNYAHNEEVTLQALVLQAVADKLGVALSEDYLAPDRRKRR